MKCRFIFALAIVAGLLAGAHLARAGEQLCFKDGTCQPVKSYEVQGDRVRYYSLDRSAWEEVPAGLVDFEATKRAKLEEESSHKEERDSARKLDHELFEKVENQGFEIAPGVRLPGDDGVFAYDGMRVIRLLQSSAEIVKDKKRAALTIAIPGPLLKSRAFVILQGERSPVRVMAIEPVFYVQSSDGLGANLALISLKARKDSRQVEKVEWRAGLGKPAELHESVPLQHTQIAPGLFKLTATQPLDPGEYALAELIQKKLNIEVWDFGVEGAPARVPTDFGEPPKIRRTEKPRED
ncbi:MAG: hypothetical protein HY508_11885 [Acidobacteria bacterium]|nr:hypothetical protein [Acidobacteriota bacterium]